MSKVKDNVYPHSKAKLDLYKDYLSEYLPILEHSIYIDKINIFDIFCGSGIYEDGNFGSPLIAASQILNTIISFEEKGKKIKPISLTINDFEKNKVDGVKQIIDALPLNNCTVEAFNLDADEMFKIVIEKQKTFSQRERNLIFIDPYGYSKITKERIYSLLSNNRSEIILFLPVAQMYRFQKQALFEIDIKAYEHLRRFTIEFFGVEGEEFVDIFDYINKLAQAFSFNEAFFTSSHYIQRDKANYYAVFFIGHHIYGLEKFLEVKWKNDSLGKGYNLKSNENSLFGDLIEEYDKSLTEEALSKLILEKLKETDLTNNLRLYEFVLKNQFLPAHANNVLRRLRDDKKMIAYDNKGINITGKKSFGLKYEDYKKGQPSIYFQLK